MDISGYASSLGVMIVGGWIDFGWDDQETCCRLEIEFDGGAVKGEAKICCYDRPDVKKVGRGFILHLPSARDAQGRIISITLDAGSHSYHLLAAHTAKALSEVDVLIWARQVLSIAPRSENRAQMLKLFTRGVFNGEDTLSKLPLSIFMEFDAVYFCPPRGLLLRGWFADPFRQIESMTIRSGDLSCPIDRNKWVRTSRPDVAEALQKQGVVDPNCGFLVFSPDIYRPGTPIYIEFQPVDFDPVHKRVPAPQNSGIAAIREVLETFELRYEELSRCYENIIGPFVQATNIFRLASPPAESLITFGDGSDIVRSSIIVPLYGRLDFMEYQLAFFARTLSADHELIYVVDDPSLSRDAQTLGAACYARFGRPFQLVSLGHNVGYAPANNIGLRYAVGDFVCFLNSDVFPEAPDWLEYMLDTINADDDIGAVGAMLLFEDGTVQHEGCTFARIPEFCDWSFCIHPNKGRLPAEHISPATVDAVTGACLLMRRQTATSLGGFDEGYVIGDFEDADLCLKLASMGMRSVVDRRARLYYLERQSQGEQSRLWRTNLTLYNAWRFQNRWDSSVNALCTLHAPRRDNVVP